MTKVNQHCCSIDLSTFILRWKSHVRSDFRLRSAQHWSGAVMTIHQRVKGEPHSPARTHITLTHLSQTLAMFCGQLQNSC